MANEKLKAIKKKKKAGKKLTKAEKELMIAYTPLSEAEKERQRKQLIKDLKSGKKGLYHSPGGNRYKV
jgi:VIT1/CCC1 family predicted Fe2+/Mn2+ transporter|tara:strand:- start:50 stop:253 length:204 start_codon:yes stop_codon:yes gene_type:complete